MSTLTNDYKYIQSKINSLREKYKFLKYKSDDYVFSALCVIHSLYKDPDKPTEDDLKNVIVDGPYDGGVDMLLADPLSDNDDLVICQSKFHKTISKEEVQNALTKMADFYKDKSEGKYGNVSDKVISRFMNLIAEVGEESKIKFILYTSAPQRNISLESLQENFMKQFPNASNVELVVMFAADIVNEIKEAELRNLSVEFGKIRIDQAKNILKYQSEAIIVNVSALSIKELYAQHQNALLTKNLRYHIKANRKIDEGIKSTIDTIPELFWMMNNGITIICDGFEADGKEVKLRNFSVINGGQTVYMIYKNKNVNSDNDFYLSCKIIQARGNNEREKNEYSLEISKAANWQKPIKDIDLRANSHEQSTFKQVMEKAGIFYQTKRGENIPRQYKLEYLHTNLAEVGKLCLCGIFQLPGTSRNKPSALYSDRHNVYDKIFNANQEQAAIICKELLYVNYYFKEVFIKKYGKKDESISADHDNITFANNSRTICVAFSALASRYVQGNITNETINVLGQKQTLDSMCEIFGNMKGIKSFFPAVLFSDKNSFDKVLDELFNTVIDFGISVYRSDKDHERTLTATNFLKVDNNYHRILHNYWQHLSKNIKKIFNEVNNFPEV